MRAVVWEGPRQMRLREVPTPHPAPGEVLLQVDAVGICGSEISGFLGHNSLRRPPLVFGHEFGGLVAALGEGIQCFQVGDPVLVNPLVTCGQCVLCQQKRENLCIHRQLIGAHRPGAFADYVTVPAGNCTPRPPGLGPVAAALAEPLACGIRGVRVGCVGPDSSVLVLGAGAIGLASLAAVQQAGGRVALISDIHPGRLETALRRGAARACNARAADAAAEARSLTGGIGVDVAIDAVGSSATRAAALRAVRAGGTVVVIGLHEDFSLLEFSYMVRNEVQFSGCFAYTPGDFAAAVEMLAAGAVRPSPDWVEERPLSECPATFAQLADNPPAVAKVVLRP